MWLKRKLLLFAVLFVLFSAFYSQAQEFISIPKKELQNINQMLKAQLTICEQAKMELIKAKALSELLKEELTISQNQLIQAKADLIESLKSTSKLQDTLKALELNKKSLTILLWVLIPFLMVACILTGGFAGYGLFYALEGLK